MSQLAPVVIFAYKRRIELERAVNALRQCTLADQTDLFLFSDGPKGDKDRSAVAEVRNYIQSISGFKKVTHFFSDHNKGLGSSIIGGVTKIFESYPAVIVLEDDLVPSKNFLQYMNQGLKTYQAETKVFSITGYSYPFKPKEDENRDAYFLPRTCSYGWATWKNRWEDIDWDIKDFEVFSKDNNAIRAFKQGGGDLFQMLQRQQLGKIDSWAIRWSYNQFKKGALTVYPVLSKIKNTGFGEQSTNTNIYNKYFTNFDTENKQQFVFPSTVKVDRFYQRQLLNFYSLTSRLKNKILTYLFKFGLIKNQV